MSELKRILVSCTCVEGVYTGKREIKSPLTDEWCIGCLTEALSVDSSHTFSVDCIYTIEEYIDGRLDEDSRYTFSRNDMEAHENNCHHHDDGRMKKSKDCDCDPFDWCGHDS